MPTYQKLLLYTIGLISLLVVSALTFVKLTRGSGAAYPDISTAPLFGDDALEVVVELPLPPGNVAVSADGRLFFNYHYLGGKDLNGHSVFELVDGEPAPYPTTAFQPDFQTTLGMLIDRQNRLWIIDTAGLDSSRNTRLFAFDLETNELVVDFTFPTNAADFAQDVQVTSDGKQLIAASTGLFDFLPASLLVVDLESMTSRTLLSGHESVSIQDWRINERFGDGVNIFYGLVDWQAGVDGIAISPDQAWLYYGGINHDTLYRIPLDLLLDPSADPSTLENRVEAVGQKPLSDGFSIDIEENVYITDVENGGIARMTPSGDLVTLVKDSRVRWADGLSFGPNQEIFFTDSAIPDYLSQNGEPIPYEEHDPYRPYAIFKFKNDIAGFPGS